MAIGDSVEKEKWVPIWGKRLLLGDSGFEIVLNTDKNKKTFTLSDPEHRIICSSDELAGLKLRAERLYKDRKEFEPKKDKANER